MRLLYTYVMLGVLSLGSSSCSLFTQDATPMIDAVTIQYKIAANALDSVEALVTNAKGIDDQQKGAILAKVKSEREKADAIYRKLLAYGDSLGSVDWKAIASEALELYTQIRTQLKE